MERIHSLSWRAIGGALVLSALTLGDECPARQEPPRQTGSIASSPAAAPSPPTAATTPAGRAPVPSAAPLFESTVRPILAAKCAPCHNPGGKMYDRLPFDQPTVVSSHADGVRKRLKGEDLLALEKWLATLPPAPSS